MISKEYVASKVSIQRPLERWYRDPLSCLHSCVAAVLRYHHLDPLEILGLAWEFTYLPGDVRREEFYYPCRYSGDLVKSMAPHHRLSSSWHRPGDAEDPLPWLVDLLAAHGPVIAAVDNFHLPFRPAYGDVHAAHLVVISGIDRRRGEVTILDATPPKFDGPIACADFLRAWSSANPADGRDVFFSDSGIDRRCLTIEVPDQARSLDRPGLGIALRANLADLSGSASAAGTAGPAALTGLTGLRGYLTDSGAGARPATRRRWPTRMPSAGRCRRRPTCMPSCCAT